MGFSINTNLAALNTQRNLLHSTSVLGTTFKRMSSGLRINQAKDDTAGLSISTRMTAQIREHNQAIRNVNDGISLAQVAEGGMQSAIDVMQRMRELAVQAANDTYNSADRADMELELDQLKAELNRMASDTEFNGMKLLDGSLTGKKIEIGKDDAVSLDISQSVEVFKPQVSYKFDGDLRDSSGNDRDGNDGTDSMITYVNDRNNNQNSAVKFDGVDDWIDVSENGMRIDSENNVYAITGWINVELGSPSGYVNLTATALGDNYSGPSVFYSNGGTFADDSDDVLRFYGGKANSGTYATSDPITAGDWHSFIGIMGSDKINYFSVDINKNVNYKKKG